MLRKLKEAFLGIWTNDTDVGSQARQKRADMNRRVANLVERALVSGEYAGPFTGDNGFMCIVLGDTKDDTEAAEVARQRIMYRLYPNVSLVSHLLTKDEIAITDDAFTMRIHCSNWFWGFINEQRDRAERLENQQPLSTLAR